MEYLQEEQILCYEELCAREIDRDERITKATIMFRENIRLANHIASQFSEPRDAALDKEDLLQSAYEGLWDACLSFDESKGFAFSTYAVPTVKGRILRTLRDTENLKTPRHYKDIRSALSRHGFTLPLSDYEIDVLLQEGKFSRKQLMDYAEPIVGSLDYELGDDENSRLGDIIPDLKATIYPTLSDDDIEKIIDKIIKYINPQHRDLVEEWMYATLAGVHLTGNELSVKYKKSQPHVSRILRNAVYLIQMHGDEVRDLFGL